MVGAFGAMLIALLVGENVAEMLPAFATFAVAAIRLMPSANRVISSMNTMQFNNKAFDKVYEILFEEEKDRKSKGREQVARMEELSLHDLVEVQDLSFRFDGAEKWLYQHANLYIPKGESVALIGTTGSGKTTMADLILGLLRPQEGTITVDGISIRLNPKKWSKMVGYIPQNIYLCDDTIKANIAYGLKDADIDETKVWQTLEQAQLADFVTSLPENINTKVGEAGVRLSGGQRQRIGIARALYFDPEFLVMDEATSALDNDTEKAIMDAIDALAGEKTLLIIAHRLTTIKKCNMVYRIENGKVMRER
jgi:ABC-type multidrug transport system fused ATPase/permease subunit